MRYLFYIIKKEIKLIFTNKYYIFFICVWPLLNILFLGGIYIYGNVTGMPVAVIDKDHSKVSRTITRYFNTSYAFNVAYKPDNIEELNSLITRNKIAMGIYIPKDTQKNIKKSLGANVEFYVDGSNFLTANLSEIEGTIIMGTLNAGLTNTMMKKRGIQPKQANAMMMPVRNDTTKLFNPTYHYGYFLTPGIWINMLGQFLLILGALTVSREIENQKFKIRNIFIFIFGKIFVYTIITLIYFEILFRIFFPLYQIPFNGNSSGAIFLSILFIIATLLLGMTMAAITGKKIDALKGCILAGSPSFLMSGYVWPLDYMPPVMRTISSFIPITPYLEGFRKIFQQNMQFEFVYPFAKSIIILLVLYFSVTYISLLIRKKGYKTAAEKVKGRERQKSRCSDGRKVGNDKH